MRHPKLAGAVLAVSMVLGLAASQVASAALLSVHPSSCVLARNVAPFDAIAGATYAQALFVNSSGGTATAYCPMPFQAGVTSFQVTTTSAATTCTMQRMSTGGASQIFFGTQVGNSWQFSTGVTPGTYVTQVACALAHGTGIRHLLNY
jgi:hypothetical protein